MNLAYAPTSLVKNFKFGPGIFKEFKKLMKEEEKIIWGHNDSIDIALPPLIEIGDDGTSSGKSKPRSH